MRFVISRLLILTLVAFAASACMKPRARQLTSGAKSDPTAKTPTPEASAVPNPAYAIGSGGTFTATGTSMRLHSTIRQVGNPVVSTGTGMALVPGAQGSLHR